MHEHTTVQLQGRYIETWGLTTALQDAISFTRSMTSWLKVVGQKTCETRPRLHAS